MSGDFVTEDWDPATLVEVLPRVESEVTRRAPAPSGSAVVPAVELPERTWRMIETAVRNYKVIVLVGPPGVGKGVTAAALVEQVREDPARFGFEDRGDGLWPNPIRRTPDDTWTAFDLIGGHVPRSDGSLRWAPGVVLDALAADRWLVLDEINRAELDKIFGPLMTFLADEPVEIGTVTPEPDAGRVTLEWSTDTRSGVEPADGLSTDDGDVVFRAGADWRILGTYNPQDATRVFGIGQALARRFREVPLAPLAPETFETFLEQLPAGFDDDVRSAVTGLYRAHYRSRRARLGPALFVEIARYAHDAGQADDTGAEIEQLVAEGYVVTIGKHAAAYRPEELAELGESPEVDEALGEEWEWVASQLENLR